MPGPKKLVGKYAVIANKMLHKVTNVMEKFDIPYVLEAGTLLGIVRENRLLPWDDDVDITITRHDSDKFLRNLDAFRKLGYKVRVKRYQRDLKYFKKGELRMIKIKHFSLPFFQSDVCVDVFVKKLIGDEYYWTVGVHKPVLKSVPRRFYEERGKLEYRGKTYSVPADYEGYLTEHYGDWKTPKKDWNFKFDDQSVREKLYDEI
jgi:phosphorylcholine metabolism protein LicD